MNYILYGSRKLKQFTMLFSHKEKPYRIIERVNRINIPFIPLADEYILYALLEILDNSWQAHRNKGITGWIRLILKVQDSNLGITITDQGGGFDITNLPYNWDDNVNDIDTTSDLFKNYRMKHNYRKCGVGLISVRRLFPVFNLSFYDRDGQDVPWSSGGVTGTRVSVLLEGSSDLTGTSVTGSLERSRAHCSTNQFVSSRIR